MSATLEMLAQDALILPPAQRLVLARRLLDSVEVTPDADSEALWQAEISRRMDRFRSGESKPVPASEVFGRLRQIAPDA